MNRVLREQRLGGRRAGLPGQGGSPWGDLPRPLFHRAAWSCGWTCSPWTCRPLGRLWTSPPGSPRSELLGPSTTSPISRPSPHGLHSCGSPRPRPPASPWSVVFPMWPSGGNRATHGDSYGAYPRWVPFAKAQPPPTQCAGNEVMCTHQHPPGDSLPHSGITPESPFPLSPLQAVIKLC